MKKIKLFDPATGKNELNKIKEILKSGFWASGTGIGYVSKFEEKFNQYIGSQGCVAVNSGTAALHLAIKLANVRDKEVILPSLSFVSTAHAVLYNGGKPIFADINPDTLCIDPQRISDLISEKSSVILPVHFAGMPCNMKEIMKICRKNNLTLIEDAAHAAGSVLNGKKIGTHGKFVCFSFHPVKNLAMPSGGAITINQGNVDKLTHDLKSLRWCGISDRIETRYDVTDIGWNYYMNEFSAGIGLEQLKNLEQNNRKRKYIAKRYHTEIEIESKMPFSKDCSYHIYWIQVEKRKKVMTIMKEKGIETGIHYFPIHKMTAYKKFSKALNNTEKVAKRIVSLPIHPNLSEDDVTRIISTVNKIQKNR